jgi:hypothetical protein
VGYLRDKDALKEKAKELFRGGSAQVVFLLLFDGLFIV